ncbi:acetylxylan esterase [Demequina sp. SYSU T00192]|uniref:Acetylxylan esterase n=1 Tax=Demequina litoralis TaxID=3051660 RepID=A0ABT8GBD9_9MICO|nr:acetylxylan esterase [Demequina sp. SYSU T00192]MDN4476451.1 acetylxylan esterase [Demequina sp. SYSU T00192]
MTDNTSRIDPTGRPPDLVPAPDDFDERWLATLDEARTIGGAEATLVAVDAGLTLVDVWDMTFAGFGGDPIKAWYVRPHGVSDDLPLVVEFLGYTDGRGLPHERLMWANAGYAYVVMDTRAQGTGGGGGGGTSDASGSGHAGSPAATGYLTRGIRRFDTHYYRRLITDAALCVEASSSLPGVDRSRVVVAGGSQGGGLAIAAAGLVDGIAAALVDVPFLCDFRRAVDLAVGDPYDEIVRYLAIHRERVEETFETLAYVDAVHHAARATAPALFSVGLRDVTCPPATVRAAYEAWGGDVEIVEYPFNGHEGGGPYQQRRQIEFLARQWDERAASLT